MTLYEWIQGRFHPGSPDAIRAVETVGPHLSPLVAEGDRVVDLCCGAGPWAFFLEERGATVTGIDVAPYMIERAREEAERRGALVEFVVADVLAHDLGRESFDLALLMGNTVADLPPASFSRLVTKTHRALTPGGRFVIQYLDGVLYFERERSRPEGIEQEAPVRVSRRYREYRPAEGAWVVTYTNESTGQRYDYATYVYPTRLLRLLLEPYFVLDISTDLGEGRFLDIFARRDGTGGATGTGRGRLRQRRLHGDLHVSGESVGDRTAVFGSPGGFFERFGAHPGDGAANRQRHGEQAPAGVGLAKRSHGLGVETIWWIPCLGESVRQCHGETGGVRRSNQLLRTRLAVGGLSTTCPRHRERTGHPGCQSGGARTTE